MTILSSHVHAGVQADASESSAAPDTLSPSVTGGNIAPSGEASGSLKGVSSEREHDNSRVTASTPIQRSNARADAVTSPHNWTSSSGLAPLPLNDWFSSSVVVSPSSSPPSVVSSQSPSPSPSTSRSSSPMGRVDLQKSLGVSGMSLDAQVLQCINDGSVHTQMSDLLRCLQPSARSESERVGVLSFVESLIRKSLGAKIFPHGSYALKTYLPDSDINVCAFFTHNHQKTWGQRAMKALCREELGAKAVQSNLAIKNTEFVNTPDLGKVIRAQVGNYWLEICSNQSQTLSSCALFEEVDRLVDKSHLFKRTVLLVKAWAIHEARVLAPHQGLLSSYCIRSMVLFLFNAYRCQIETPLQGLVLLLQYLMSFDWDRHAFGLFGPVHLESLPRYESVTGEPTSWPAGTKPLISKTLLSRYCVDPSSVGIGSEGRNGFATRFLNIIDPRDPLRNLGASLTRKAAAHIRESLVWSARRTLGLLRSWRSGGDATALIRKLVPGTFDRYAALSTQAESSGSGVLESDLGSIIRHILQANEFEMPDISEYDLVRLIVEILKENDGVVTVGKMGSLMHSATNNHSLPAMLKTRYGGLKKLLRRHEDIFALAADHPHNPHVMLLPTHEAALVRCGINGIGMLGPVPSPVEKALGSAPVSSDDTALMASLSFSRGSAKHLLSPVATRPVAPIGRPSSAWGSPLLPSPMTRASLPPKRPSSVPALSPLPSTSDSMWSAGADTASMVTSVERRNNAWVSPSSPAWHHSLPDEFFCPISGTVMSDPVVAPDGVTYDRASIESVHQQKGAFSPLTGLPLDLAAVYPNLALKALLGRIRCEQLQLICRSGATRSQHLPHSHSNKMKQQQPKSNLFDADKSTWS